MAFLTVNDIRYHCDIRGVGEPILLLHGFTGSAASWEVVTPALSRRFTVIAPDLIGHGQTETSPNWQRYGIDQCADDLAALLNELNISSAHILGYSMGGRIALYMALTHPELVRSLILESSSPGITEPDMRQERRNSDEQLAAQIEQNGIEWFVNYWENLPLFSSQKRLTEHVRLRQRSQRLLNNLHGLAYSLRGVGAGVQPSLWDRLQELTCPTLLITGELDTKYCQIASQMMEVIPDGKLEILPDSGHNPHLEASKQFTETVLDFLTSLRSKP